MRSTQMRVDDFHNLNGQKKQENEFKRQRDRQEYHASKLDYFPFISGELLEQHRHGLNQQMAADLKNYLVAKSQGVVGNGRGQKAYPTSSDRFRATQSSLSGTSSILSPIVDGHIDLRNDRLTRNLPVKTMQMKPLNDSCYVKPE